MRIEAERDAVSAADVRRRLAREHIVPAVLRLAVRGKQMAAGDVELLS